ncbi:ethanolamine ammonia-lyase subunit EutC [Brevibacillus agri]|uniref:ethanolamine ammonia-lyase subunit EutC n=1 Tax=Bacillota TaxID=1239 RepID=UPI0002A4D16E|nr:MULTISPECIES: ethanolamine ammonia-lyase subunit EutC [Bacillota]ELK43552.1 ethanolamine ammonia-lyase light chain [Brevibacillus agri BAB-2500]MBY0052620.1 ethanolamine ammonia-lyase subunit EutC [Brevibacillus agri]MDN4095745.1 ethanolamine ammonia-lyase subunit EutC [Brevibacillus agri]MDR9504627.1 ethanolamine ammonia-lyase subunit EutC [Brevibacillus agri]MDT8018947.1 ethanolamine ammonia-lyase subunit EutC [Clostridium perfringens]
MEQQLDFLVDKVVAELQKKLTELGEKAPEPKAAAAADAKAGAQQEAAPAPMASRPQETHAAPAEPERTAQIPNPKWKEGLDELLASTPARIGVWRTGVRPLTKTMLQLRRDHAAAVDAVYGEVSQEVLDQFSLFTVETQYDNTENYLKRPDMGRVLTEEGVRLLQERCQKKPQVQIVVSDGLSASAVDANLKDVLPSLMDSLKSYGLSCGTPFFVKGGRVASMDHIGEILEPEVLVLLIGERPGLVTAHSMSAYMCYRPRKGMVESERTVISNIHRQGTSPIEAGAHIGTILSKMLEQKASGVKLVL